MNTPSSTCPTCCRRRRGWPGYRRTNVCSASVPTAGSATLDTAPPLSLLTALSQRSGIALNRLRSMSFAGWVPWLLDSLDAQIPAALDTYAFQFSILLPKRNRKTSAITSWRAWMSSRASHRACPLCLNDPANQAVLLAWKLPLMLGCPLHGCWLESCWGVPGRFFGWENPEAAPRTASHPLWRWTGAPGMR
jgi:hypothetical protein